MSDNITLTSKTHTEQNEINAVPFYSEENMQYLRMSITQMEQGQVITKSLDELIKLEQED